METLVKVWFRDCFGRVEGPFETFREMGMGAEQHFLHRRVHASYANLYGKSVRAILKEEAR